MCDQMAAHFIGKDQTELSPNISHQASLFLMSDTGTLHNFYNSETGVIR